MKHLADYIKILPLTDYASFNGTTLVSKSGAAPDHLVANNRLVFDPKPETSAGGPFYTENLKVVTDKLTDVQRQNYTIRRPVVVLLFTDMGEPVLWGGFEQKVRATITPNTDYDILELTRKTTKALF